MIDVDTLLDSFRDTTLHVIMSMAPVEIEPGEICFAEQDNSKCDVIGNINMTGEGKLSLALRFSWEAVHSIYKHVFPEEADSADEAQLKDLVGEITNMVCGNAKNILAELGMKFDSSVPIMIVGAHQVYHGQGTISRLIPVKLDGHPMSVQVSIKED